MGRATAVKVISQMINEVADRGHMVYRLSYPARTYT